MTQVVTKIAASLFAGALLFDVMLGISMWTSVWLGAFYVGLLDGLVGVAGMIITSDDWDHSRKFPTKHQ